ncbi:MAG: AAA family ATPase [Spirochaetes bacterium]|nr:AAA family ATPase [Spirochaetota bacterium]
MFLQKVTFRPEHYPANDGYPFGIRLFHDTGEVALNSPVTFFVGENGSGKSTLLKAIARRCGIHIWDEPERGRCVKNPLADELYRYIDVHWEGEPVPGAFFASELFHHFATNVDDWASVSPGILKYYGDRSLLTQSHGQYHMSYFRNRYNRRGIYLLDEPENALSPATQLQFLDLVLDYAAAGHAQFIIATHSPILLAMPDARILSFDGPRVSTVSYQDTSHYKIYRLILNDDGDYFSKRSVP